MTQKSIKYSFILITTSISLSVFACNNKVQKIESEPEKNIEVEDNRKQLELERLKAKADSAKSYIKDKRMDESFCILIDFSIHSGKNRLFVWDFKGDSLIYSGLCCHGIGNPKKNLSSRRDKPTFSNESESYCSSLGRYKMGIRSYSQWGINVHYKMHGLDPTNSNAFKRIVVLHSHNPVPDNEIYPRHLPLGYSLGCPVVSNNLMRKLDVLLKQAQKPILMWIYN